VPIAGFLGPKRRTHHDYPGYHNVGSVRLSREGKKHRPAMARGFCTVELGDPRWEALPGTRWAGGARNANLAAYNVSCPGNRSDIIPYRQADQPEKRGAWLKPASTNGW